MEVNMPIFMYQWRLELTANYVKYIVLEIQAVTQVHQ